MTIKVSEFKEINKENILSLVTEWDIYEFYCNQKLNEGVLIHSPLRSDDDTPSFSFYTDENGNVKWKDFGRGWKGDVFDFVCQLPRFRGIGKGMWWACCRINYDMKLGLNGFNSTLNNDKTEMPKGKAIVKERSYYQIVPQPFTEADLNYWNQYYIRESTLKRFNVFSVKTLYKNGVEHSHYSIKDPMYAFIYPTTDSLKIYKPLQLKKELKWKQSYSEKQVIQGIEQLSNFGELLIITKSLKDVMVLYELGFNSIAPQSENARFDEDIIKEIKRRFSFVVVLYDHDNAGILGASVLATKGIPSIFIEKEKDISDYIKQYGPENAKNHLLNLLKNVYRTNKEEKQFRLF